MSWTPNGKVQQSIDTDVLLRYFSVTLSTKVTSYTAFLDSFVHLMNQLGREGQVAVEEPSYIIIYTLFKRVFELGPLDLLRGAHE